MSDETTSKQFFETWWNAKYISGEMTTKDAAWNAWQASREARIIEGLDTMVSLTMTSPDPDTHDDQIQMVCRKPCPDCDGTGRPDAGFLADGTQVYGMCLTCHGGKYVDEAISLSTLAALLNDLGPRHLHPETEQ